MASNIRLSNQKIHWLKVNYATTKNAVICEYLGIKLYKLWTLAKKYKLEKSEEFMRKVAKENSDLAQIINKKDNYAKQRENFRKAKEEGRTYKFPKGKSWIRDMCEPERRAELLAKMSENRKRLIAEERKRIAWGFPQKTKLRVHEQNRPRSAVKYKLRKQGYIFDKEKYLSDRVWIFYYNEETQRTKAEEKYTKKFHFKFIEL